MASSHGEYVLTNEEEQKMKKSVLALLLAVIMTASLLTVGAFAAEPDGSRRNPYTTVEAYNAAVANDGFNGEDIYLTIRNKDFKTEGSFKLTNVQSRVNPPKLHLTLIGCTFEGNTSGDGTNTSFMYLPNCQELIIRDCTFDAGSGLKYGINWNLIQIQDAEVTISNCTFSGKYVENAIKLTQRNGSDDIATDVNIGDGEFQSTIKSAVIENCDLGDNLILLGSVGKNVDNGASPSTGAFPVTITAPADKSVNVFLAYNASEEDAYNAMQDPNYALENNLAAVVPPCGAVSKTSGGDPVASSGLIEIDDGRQFMTMAAAVTEVGKGGTITVLDDITNATGTSVPSESEFTIDFGGHEYVLVGPGAGSSGTETNGFQLLKDSTITMKNGTIRIAPNARDVMRLVQNYANLTLENMNFYAQNQVGGEDYALSFNNGDIVFKGDTNIYTTSDDAIAFDVCKYADYPSANVTFDETYTGTVNGVIVYDSPNATTHSLTIKGEGTFGSIETSRGSAAAPAITVYGGSFAESVSEYLADGLNYEVESGSGRFSYYSTLDDALDAVANDNGAVITGVGDATGVESYTVKLVYGNGEVNFVQTLPAGSEFILPDVSNSGYIFLGWRNGNVTYKAGDAVTVNSDMTFTAVWGNLPDVDPEEPTEPEVPDFPFYDVNVRDWYYDAVYYVWDKGLMDGVDTHEFAPNATLTRAMVWTIIARAEGVDTTGGASWYAKAQEWVVAKGISDGENPSAAITRQELVTMLYRLAGEPSVSGTITAPDAASVSAWASDAMVWAMNIGLIEGDENGAVTPTATATRAQAAAIFMRYIEA